MLLDRGGTPLDGQLPVDRDERDREDDAADRCPEPLAAWPDERQPVGIDEHHGIALPDFL